jgi:hypothetical protein
MHLLRFAQDQPPRLIVPASAQLPQQIVWQPLVRVMVREPKAQHPRLPNHATGPSAMFGRCHCTNPSTLPQQSQYPRPMAISGARLYIAQKHRRQIVNLVILPSSRTVPLPQTQASLRSCRGSNRPAAHKTAVAESRRSALLHQIAYCLLSASRVHFLLVPACKVSCRYGT